MIHYCMLYYKTALALKIDYPEESGLPAINDQAANVCVPVSISIPDGNGENANCQSPSNASSRRVGYRRCGLLT